MSHERDGGREGGIPKGREPVKENERLKRCESERQDKVRRFEIEDELE